jgi:hypothetical protein
VCLERLGGKNAVSSVIGLDLDTAIEGKPFILFLSDEGLARSCRNLVVNEHMAGCVIGKNRPASQLVFLGFFAKGMGQSARDRRHILVEGDAVAGLKIFTNQRINLLGVRDRSISVRSFCRGLGEAAGSAKGRFSVSSAEVLRGNDRRLPIGFAHESL